MKYIPLVALLLCQTSAIGAEQLPALKTQVTPYNAPPTILAQDEDGKKDDDSTLPGDVGTGAEAVCEDHMTKGECEAAGCTWAEAEDDEDGEGEPECYEE